MLTSYSSLMTYPMLSIVLTRRKSVLKSLFVASFWKAQLLLVPTIKNNHIQWYKISIIQFIFFQKNYANPPQKTRSLVFVVLVRESYLWADLWLFRNQLKPSCLTFLKQDPKLGIAVMKTCLLRKRMCLLKMKGSICRLGREWQFFVFKKPMVLRI